MSGTISVTALTMIMVCRTLVSDKYPERNMLIFYLLVSSISWLVCSPNSLTHFNTMTITEKNERNPFGYELYVRDGCFTYGTMERFIGKDNVTYSEDLIYNYFTYDYKDKAFYKYLAR